MLPYLSDIRPTRIPSYPSRSAWRVESRRMPRRAIADAPGDVLLDPAGGARAPAKLWSNVHVDIARAAGAQQEKLDFVHPCTGVVFWQFDLK